MNQYRWTCLTTLILGASIAPISTVEAKVPSPAIASEDNYLPLSPQSLPTITPLTVTVETDPIPTAIQPVPQVSKLPIVALSADRTKQPKKIARVGILTKNLPPQSPTVITTPIFNPNFQVTEPIVAIPNSTPVNAVAPIPQITALPKPQAFRSFIDRTASAPISVVRSDDSQPTVINNSIDLQAEIARQPQRKDYRRSTAIGTKNQSIAIATPQLAIIPDPNNRSDLPSFEAGFPIFSFDNQLPRQIVTTAIAQMGDEIVAPESSIAIPVERPKQSTIPASVPASSLPQPGTGIVKIEQPSATVQPALTKIVATQTGKASWYGSEAGSQTASGERYNPSGLTAAHRTLPFGTKVRLTSIKTGKTVTVRINDRGPFHSRRIIDVSAGAAEAIGIKNAGIGEIRMDILALER